MLTACKLIALVSLAAVLFGCSSDPETPIGSQFVEDGVLGSRPGTVYEDTMLTGSGDTSFHVSSIMAHNTFLTVGSENNYRTSILMKVDFSKAEEDYGKIVRKATLRLRLTSVDTSTVIPARFYELLEPFSEGDTITSLERSSQAIEDESLVNVDREIKYLGDYTLRPDLVEAWINGTSEHNGIAIVPDTSVSDAQLTLGSRENEDASLHPFLEVVFQDQSTSNYPIGDDATFVDALKETSNLVISDGYARRVHIPVDLSKLDKNAALHRAVLILRVVPESEIGTQFEVLVYAPGTDDLDSPEALSGTAITKLDAETQNGVLEIPVRNVLLLFLREKLENHGFILQFDGEGSQIRQLEFYNSSAGDSLRPIIKMTYSSPPVFDR